MPAEKFEKPEVPITPTPEQEKTAEQVEASKNTTSVLNSENKSFFERMSDGGKRIANQVYEGLYKIPGVNRIVGKMEIAYNQFWIDRHQEKAVKYKEKMDDLDLRIGKLDQSKKEIESVIEDLKQQNVPGVESLEIKLQDVDRQKAGLLNEKDRVQTKFEAMDNKIKLYTNERDRVADKLIERYEEKLRPMEAELERLQTLRDQTDLLVAVTEARHKELLAKIDAIEKKKEQIEDALRKTGMSEKEIRKFEAIKQLEKVLVDSRKKMRLEKENLTRHKTEIDKKIAKIDAKANPYRDKREEFLRIKERRPIKIEVTEREKGKVSTKEEEVKVHRRVEKSDVEKPAPKLETKEETKKTEDKERWQVSDYLTGWNAFVKETYKKAAILVDTKDFLQETHLSTNFRLDFKDFKNILGRYLKFKKLPMEQFNKSIDVFFEEKVKTEK